jgi:hypothetical protein
MGLQEPVLRQQASVGVYWGFVVQTSDWYVMGLDFFWGQWNFWETFVYFC